NQDTIEHFQLRPNVVFNTELTKVAASNPATKRYLDRDIFTYVAALPGEQMDIEEAKRINDTLDFQPYQLGIGETITDTMSTIRLTGISSEPVHPEYKALPGDLALMAELQVENLQREEIDSVAALVYLRDGLVYGYPAQINDLNMRIRLSDAAIRSFYPMEDSLNYQQITLQQGDSVNWQGYSLTLETIDRAASHPHYSPLPDDIAVNAVISVEYDDRQAIARPLYYIRDARPANIKTYLPELGLHIRFEHIDPATETFTFRVAAQDEGRSRLPVEIARNVPRNDIIVLEAIVFPGINLFWLGAILMMAGLFVGMWAKLKRKS
ncbi:MAG: hypothetical protein R3330_18615, partial [Saprospiraceae bacterium]|nr:hypothetical protein [Saprospiraceae bacterium]